MSLLPPGFRQTLLLTFTLFFSTLVFAEIRNETFEYLDGDTRLQGYISWDDSFKGKRPGVLVVHEWWGLNDYIRMRANMLAELGYVAFAVDMYGNNQVTTHPDQATTWMNQITENIDAWQQRANLWLLQMKAHPLVDDNKTAAIGYCFGGATVLQLAYSGADIDGVVSFHGSLPAATEAQYSNINAKILAFHGNADPFVSTEQLQSFRNTLEAAGANWQLITFGGVKHSFTNPDAGDYGLDPLVYDANADRRSWQAMQSFFAELFSD